MEDSDLYLLLNILLTVIYALLLVLTTLQLIRILYYQVRMFVLLLCSICWMWFFRL